MPVLLSLTDDQAAILDFALIVAKRDQRQQRRHYLEVQQIPGADLDLCARCLAGLSERIARMEEVQDLLDAAPEQAAPSPAALAALRGLLEIEPKLTVRRVYGMTAVVVEAAESDLALRIAAARAAVAAAESTDGQEPAKMEPVVVDGALVGAAMVRCEQEG